MYETLGHQGPFSCHILCHMSLEKCLKPKNSVWLNQGNWSLWHPYLSTSILHLSLQPLKTTFNHQLNFTIFLSSYVNQTNLYKNRNTKIDMFYHIVVDRQMCRHQYINAHAVAKIKYVYLANHQRPCNIFTIILVV